MVNELRRWGTVLLALMLASALLLTFAPASQGQPSDDSDDQPPPGTSGSGERSEATDTSRMLQRAEREGSVRVIVRLRTDFVPEGRLSRPEVADQRGEIESAQAGLQGDLAGTEFQTLREYETIPYIALEVSPRALEAIQRSSLATDIVEDRLDEPLDEPSSKGLDSTNLAQSTPLVQAPTMWANGFTGNGQVVAVLDTGVDSAHPFLAGKVVEEACFTSNRVAGSGNCPNGTSTQTGAGSGVPCTYAASGCRHGTHVAGIAAGQGSSFSGVARGASVMSVQVFTRFTGANCAGAGEDPCPLSWTSDQIAGLERVFALRSTRSFSSVNMSLGGGSFTSNCDTDPRKAVIDNLRSAGIATVISSGNDGFTSSMGAPACISSAVSVGSTTKSDTVSSFSNSASFLSLLAPGESINSSVPGGGFAFFSGTSMAAPHVAGAWALLKHQNSSASVASLLSALQSTGLSVTDTRPGGGITKPRIRIANAAGLPTVGPPNDNFASGQVLNGFSASASGTNTNATLETGDPTTIDTRNTSHTVWYRWTAPSSGAVEMNTCTADFDTLLGVYRGSALGTLTEVAADDDTSGCGSSGLSSKVAFNATSGTTYRILVDGFNGQQGTFSIRVLDMASPRVTSTAPANNATGVAPGANVRARFSEPMQASSASTISFKLKKAGTTTFRPATVTYDPATKTATLNPNSNLQSRSTYIAVVTTGAQDQAGNSLDQNASLAGNQAKSWKFKVR
jgi:subtilisin